MTTSIFDGKKLAEEKLENLKGQVLDFNSKHGRKLTLAAVQIGDLEENTKYLSLKTKIFSRVGAEVKLFKYESGKTVEEYISEIEKLNSDTSLDGIMIQLPLGTNLNDEDRVKMISAISSSKDVDGMKAGSGVTAPVVLAVLLALGEACNQLKLSSRPVKVLVLGSHGFVGSKVMETLANKEKLSEMTGLTNCELTGIDMESIERLRDEVNSADIIVSTTGRSGLILADWVKNGFVGIDVGAPGAEFAEGCSQKASFMTPVPGGVGPLTVSYLLENLVKVGSQVER